MLHSQLEAGHAANQSPGSIWDKLQTKDAQLGILSMVLLVSFVIVHFQGNCKVSIASLHHQAWFLQIFQGTALSLILRYSRTGIGPPYLASVAVIWTEFIKLVICVAAQCLVCKRTAREKGITYLREVQHDLRDIISTSFPMIVPAALFVMQQVMLTASSLYHCASSAVSHWTYTGYALYLSRLHCLIRTSPEPIAICLQWLLHKCIDAC